jgi:hypothetical protein
MEQIERIARMEQQLEVASRAVKGLAAALDDYEAAQEALRELESYYCSEKWKQDFAADEAGRLPQEMKRGVLSEDAVWNLLEERDRLELRMKGIQ